MATNYKLVFSGPVGAGKSTAIQSLSDIEAVNTDANASDETKRMKKTTTVAMDYGVVNLASGDLVHLYGTPGQRRFDFMWSILSEDALGLILTLSADAADPVADLRTFVAEFRDFIERTSLVVGITRTDLSASGWQVRQRISQALVELGLPPMAMDLDARCRHQVALLIRALVHSIDPLDDFESDERHATPDSDRT